MTQKRISSKSWSPWIRWIFVILRHTFIISFVYLSALYLLFYLHSFFKLSFFFDDRLFRVIIIGYISIVIVIQLFRTFKYRHNFLYIVFILILAVLVLFVSLIGMFGGAYSLSDTPPNLELAPITTLITAITGLLAAVAGFIGQLTARKKMYSEIEIEKQKLEIEHEKLRLEKEKLKNQKKRK